jgi:hypothetical protein
MKPVPINRFKTEPVPKKYRSTSPNFKNFMVSNLALTDSIIDQVVKKLKIILKNTRFIFGSKSDQNLNKKTQDLKNLILDQ